MVITNTMLALKVLSVLTLSNMLQEQHCIKKELLSVLKLLALVLEIVISFRPLTTHTHHSKIVRGLLKNKAIPKELKKRALS